MRILRVIKEFRNYREYVRTIKKESFDSPLWAKYKLRRDWLNRVYTVVNLPPTITNSSDFPEEAKPGYVMEEISPINEYLGVNLNLQELITVSLNPIKENNGNSFLVVYFFLFREFTILWLIKYIFFISSLTALSIYWEETYNYLISIMDKI